MTRTHAALRLLEHGPLQFREFLEITRWKSSVASRALRDLKRRKRVSCVNHQRYTVWRLV